MRHKIFRRAPKGEEGAVLVIVVLSLIALFGMMVLVVDVGSLLFARRALVNAADAAALAAAQSCIGIDEDAEEFADLYATVNVNGTTIVGGISEAPNCHENEAGLVRVEYGGEWPLFFAGVLGYEDGSRVATEATAHWGPTGTASPIPLVIYEGAIQGECEVPFVVPGVTCYIWEDNDITGGGDFGFLDVEDGWNVSKNDGCPNAGGVPELRDWIDGSRPVGTLSLNYPLATWVCTKEMEGGNNPAWRALEDLIGEERDFPIIGVTPGDGEPAQIPNPNTKYNVIGFAHLEIVDVRMASKLNNGPIDCPIPETATLPIDLIAECAPDGVGAEYTDGSAVPTPDTVILDVDPSGVIQSWSEKPTNVTFAYTSLVADCGGRPPPNKSAHCLVLRWNGATIGGGRPGGGANFGINAIALCDRRYGSCLDPA